MKDTAAAMGMPMMPMASTVRRGLLLLCDRTNVSSAILMPGDSPSLTVIADVSTVCAVEEIEKLGDYFAGFLKERQ